MTVKLRRGVASVCCCSFVRAAPQPTGTTAGSPPDRAAAGRGDLTGTPADRLTNCSVFLSFFQDPAGIFELVEVVGNGTYGQVYKVG